MSCVPAGGTGILYIIFLARLRKTPVHKVRASIVRMRHSARE